MNAYWNPESNLFEVRTPLQPASYDLPGDPFHYWWQAHALDALVDAWERDGSVQHLERAAGLLSGLTARNGGLTNEYYDDMEWLALACLRAYDALLIETLPIVPIETQPIKTQPLEAFKTAALTLWADIKTGWNETCGGGIAWRKPQLDYKNTPANAPAAILAARLYRRFHDPADLDWARRIFSWLETHLIDPETGFVWDGMNRDGDGAIDRDWAFTYCQGVTVGAALELQAITGEQHFLDRALKTARAARAHLSDSVTQAMPDEGGGDAGLFKGILVRYLAQLVRETGDAGSLAWLRENARLAWTNRDPRLGLSGLSWTRPPEFPLDLSTALSGVMLLEAMAWLERQPEKQETRAEQP